MEHLTTLFEFIYS